MLLTFSEWVNVLTEAHDPQHVDENRRNRPSGNVGGAFGRSGRRPGGSMGTKGRGAGTYTHSRDQQRSLQGPDAYASQIAFGKAQEKKIFAAAAQSCGLRVTPGTPYEDQVLKIDGYWWPEGGGGKQPFSMKYRDTGDDVLFEVIKPYVADPILDAKNRLGRDVKPAGQPANQFNPASAQGPKYIMFLSRAGNKLSIIEAQPCYKVIQDMLEEINDRGWNQEARSQRKVHITSNGVMRLQTDSSSGVQKVMAYLSLRVAVPIFQCDVNINIE